MLSNPKLGVATGVRVHSSTLRTALGGAEAQYLSDCSAGREREVEESDTAASVRVHSSTLHTALTPAINTASDTQPSLGSDTLSDCKHWMIMPLNPATHFTSQIMLGTTNLTFNPRICNQLGTAPEDEMTEDLK